MRYEILLCYYVFLSFIGKILKYILKLKLGFRNFIYMEENYL